MKFSSDVSHVTRGSLNRHYPNLFCLATTFSSSPFKKYWITVTFHPRQWSQVSPLWPSSRTLSSNLNQPLASRPDPITLQPPPVTRAILPAFTAFRFQGFCEYLEDLLARIDAPQLKTFSIEFLHQGPRYRLSPPAKNEGVRPENWASAFIFGIFGRGAEPIPGTRTGP
jgi:hypothetical protein